MKNIVQYLPEKLQEEIVVADTLAQLLVILETNIATSGTTVKMSDVAKKVISQLSKVKVKVDEIKQTWEFDWTSCNQTEIIKGQYLSHFCDMHQDLIENECHHDIDDDDEEEESYEPTDSTESDSNVITLTPPKRDEMN